MLLIYVFQYEKAYEEYPEEQIKSLGSRWEDLQYYETLYSNRVEQLEEYDPEYERLEPIKKTAGILVSLRALCGLQVDCWEDWEKNEDMLRDLRKTEGTGSSWTPRIRLIGRRSAILLGQTRLESENAAS